MDYVWPVELFEYRATIFPVGAHNTCHVSSPCMVDVLTIVGIYIFIIMHMHNKIMQWTFTAEKNSS